MSISTIRGNGVHLHTHPIAAGEYYGKPSGSAVTAIIRDSRNPGFDADYERRASEVMDSIILGMKPVCIKPKTTHPDIKAEGPLIVLEQIKSAKKARRPKKQDRPGPPSRSLDDVRAMLAKMLMPPQVITWERIRVKTRNDRSTDQYLFANGGKQLTFPPLPITDKKEIREYWAKIVNDEILSQNKDAYVKLDKLKSAEKRFAEKLQKVIKLPRMYIDKSNKYVYYRKDYDQYDVRYVYKRRISYFTAFKTEIEAKNASLIMCALINKEITRRRKGL